MQCRHMINRIITHSVPSLLTLQHHNNTNHTKTFTLLKDKLLTNPLSLMFPESPNGMLTSTLNKPLKDLTQESPSTKPVKLKYSWNKKDFLPTKLKVFKLLSGISLLALSENTIES